MELARELGGGLTAQILSRQISPENLHYNMHDPRGVLGSAEIRIENGRGEEVARWKTIVEQQPDGSFQPGPDPSTRTDVRAMLGDIAFRDALHFGGRAVHDAVQTTWDRLRDRDEAGVEAMRDAASAGRFAKGSFHEPLRDGIRMHAEIYADRERIGANFASGMAADPADILDGPPNAYATVVVQSGRASPDANTVLRFELGADGRTELRFPEGEAQANALLQRELGVDANQSQSVLEDARNLVASRAREMAREAERERQERTGDRPTGAEPAAQRKPERAHERSVSEIESALAERGYRVEMRADELGIDGPALLDGKTGERVDEADVSPEAFALAVEWNHAHGHGQAREYQAERAASSDAGELIAKRSTQPLQQPQVQAEQKPMLHKALFSDPVHGQVRQSQADGGVRIESQARAFRDQYERLAAGVPLPEVPSGAILGTVAVRIAGEDGRSTTLNFANMRGTEADWRNDFVPLGTGGDASAKAQIAHDLGVSPEKADRIYESVLLTSQEANRDAVREAYRDRTKEAEAQQQQSASKARDAGDHER